MNPLIIWRNINLAMLLKISRCLLAELPPSYGFASQPAEKETVEYVNSALLLAPWFIQASEQVARIVLWLWLTIFMGSPSGFAAIGGTFANFIRLYRSLVMFAYAESDAFLSARGKKTPKQIQALFRDLRNNIENKSL